MVGVGDFDGDGSAGVLFQRAAGSHVIIDDANPADLTGLGESTSTVRLLHTMR